MCDLQPLQLRIKIKEIEYLLSKAKKSHVIFICCQISSLFFFFSFVFKVCMSLPPQKSKCNTSAISGYCLEEIYLLGWVGNFSVPFVYQHVNLSKTRTISMQY